MRFRGREITHPEKAERQLRLIVERVGSRCAGRSRAEDGRPHDDAAARAAAPEVAVVVRVRPRAGVARHQRRQPADKPSVSPPSGPTVERR